ncbi:NADPH-dependent FMN reductase [Helcococcus ovis]|uniref:NADPH-dependent oxidoreductase n=1 Tax=Helcococcus ovis TaxID=72026 RepID=A0A4R9C0I7_9FIRM|nr:NAD(P)H-dependent oxidoreductase [Helcococcus ovis]TFF64955.1 NADPH-dependent oxidoreductase [Helcococcus ovis]TFF65298.1 NADPH-dependent oxidoreductase [Helcococcus ovis]
MKFVGIAGSISDKSYNKMLLDYAKFIFNDVVEIEILDIKDIPLFNQDLNQDDYPKIKELSDKIESSDGVIIVTPEHNYTIPAVLKSVIEWFSFNVHPLKNKPVMILGASYTEQGTSRAQLHLRQILDSPGVDAFVMPGNEFLLSNVREKFDKDGTLIHEQTSDYLEHCLLRFMKYAELIKKLDIDNIESKFTLTLKAGGYVNIDDPYSDGTAGASEY